MLNINPLAALSFTLGRRKSKASRLDHRKGGALADARENVKRVHRQVANFEQSCEWHELDEGQPTKRIVWGFFNAVRHHERALTGYSEDNVEAIDSLERESDHLVAAASTLYAIDPALYQVRVGVSLLAGVRGLDSKEAFERYLADLEMIAEDRRERAAFFKERREEGYTDANGVERSAAELAARAERDAARNADPTGRDAALSFRTSATGRGLQNEESNNESMRSRQDYKAGANRRLRNAIAAAHKERNAPPPPSGAERVLHGYVVRGYLVPQGEPNPATWDRAEIERRVAEFRERTGVPELDQSESGRYVRPYGDGWKVQPPVAMRRPLQMRGDPKEIYCATARCFTFPEKDEADVALEKFMSQSTSNDERKKMLTVPPEAYTCAHCGQTFKGRNRVRDRRVHESSCAPEQSSSSEEEESDEDESEEVEPEEVVAPPPKRARFFSWPWRSSE